MPFARRLKTKLYGNDMKCPICHVNLERTEYEGTIVFQCKTCLGYMVDQPRVALIKTSHGKSQQQLQEEASAPPPRSQDEPVRCPRCHAKMETKKINVNLRTSDHVVLDQCDLCHATWFDPGELARMQLDYEKSSQAIEQFRQKSLAASRTEQQREEARNAIEHLPVDWAASSVITDVMLLLSVILLAALTLFFKIFEFHLLAGLSFLVITAIAICAAFRFLDETFTERVVAAGIGIIGLILSLLIWSWT